MSKQVSVGALLLEPRDGVGQVSGGNRLSPQSADASEFEKTTLGISFIALANGPEAPGQ